MKESWWRWKTVEAGRSGGDIRSTEEEGTETRTEEEDEKNIEEH